MHSVEKCFYLNQNKINIDQWSIPDNDIPDSQKEKKKEWRVASIKKHRLSVYWIFLLPAPIVIVHKKPLDLIKLYRLTSQAFFSKTDIYFTDHAWSHGNFYLKCQKCTVCNDICIRDIHSLELKWVDVIPI